jgi:photosystem II stability/assembly factor-like uncharacterized protein
MRLSLLICFTLFTFYLEAQKNPHNYTPAAIRMKSMEKRTALKEQSLVDDIPFRSVGPTVFSGRVVDLAIHPEDPTIFYVGYASGGLWKTESNGSLFTPIFDDEVVMTVGDIAVNWKNNTIWVGTGEVNSSRSSYAGAGIFKSTDEGKTWEHMGLPETHHIGRILLHPTDSSTLWVAALGHLYSPNSQRGVFKTTDGGKTWKKTLFVNDNTGAVDLIIDPNNPDVLYAATWERSRRSWNFVEAGNGSGIYKSTDGGVNWTLLSTPKSGLPAGEGLGRIGLNLVYQDGNPILYTIIDNYNRRPKEEEDEKEELVKNDFKTMDKSAFLKLEKEALKTFLEANNFPEKYTAEKVMKMVETNKIKPAALAEYLEDANSLLFDTPVIGAEVYKSTDGGQKWEKTHEGYLNSLYNSYGYYFGQIAIAPYNPDKIYVMGVPILRSDDGGKTFTSINGDNVHADHHAIWINPEREGHLIIGNDGGVNISYNDGENWFKCNSPAVGQFYSVEVDMKKPYRVYGGLQDNGVWVGPSNYRGGTGWHGSGDYPYDFLMGGDGMQVQVDTRDNETVYTGFQFGNYYRINQQTGKRTYITPKHELGDRPFRWNWQTPIHLSAHNQDILYIGSNFLHRSFDQGDNFEIISEDLTQGGLKGDVPYGTLTSVHESPLQFGLIYVGSDDGYIHVTKDAGHSWQRISDDLPQDMWVSRVQASRHDKGTVYATLNGYRWDHFIAYAYMSNDYGATWQRLAEDFLPEEPVNVIKEDPENPDILYLGTDHGLYVSLDKGANWMLMNKDLPAAPVHDLVIHPRDKDLVVGTHGRSIYIADVSHLQQLNKELMEATLHAFDVNKVRFSSYWGNRSASWRDYYEPKIKLPVFVKTDGRVLITLFTKEDLPLFQKSYEVSAGIQYPEYDLRIDESLVKRYERELTRAQKEGAEEVRLEKADNGHYYIQPGKYKLIYEKEGKKVEKELLIEER